MSHEHIPTAEIEQDIADIEREIAQMEQEATWLREVRLNDMRASARRSGIKERQEFIAKLRAILEERT